MNQGNQEMMICPKCGSQMSTTSRCCLKCGWLNPNDPANQNMQHYVSHDENTLYQVGSGQNIIQDTNQVITSVISNSGNTTICFLLNYLIYMAIILFSFFTIVGNNVTDFNFIKNSSFPYIAFGMSVLFLYIYSMQLIFIKCNKRWWYFLIPIYNLFVLSDIVYKKKWLGILLLIPVIGQIFLLVVLYKLGTKFKYNGLLSMLFPIIYIPLMGFGSRLYEDVNYISGDRGLEKDYKRKRLFFVSILLFFLMGGGIIFWNNIVDIKSAAFKLSNYYYIYATNGIVNKTKQLTYNNYLECEYYDYSDDKGIYYMEYSDVGDEIYMPFHLYRDVISAYVIVDNSSGSSKYYVSMSDGTYGYPETLYDDIKVDSIVLYEDIGKRTDLNKCVAVKHKTSIDRKK